VHIRRWIALLGLAVGCASPTPPSAPEATSDPEPRAAVAQPAPEVLARARQARILELERDLERLRADLREAEQALRTAESGVQTANTRAEAVSVVAEARLGVTRAERAAPWRKAKLEESRALVAQAELELGAEHFGTAALLASRAGRGALSLVEEAKRLLASEGARRVRVPRANLRSAPTTKSPVVAVLAEKTPVFTEQSDETWTLVRTPDGEIGWIHSSLLDRL
jgi:hypothetical protein